MRQGAPILALVVAALCVSAAAPSQDRFVRVDSTAVNAALSPRVPARAAVDWCGASQPPTLDRKPDVDLSSTRQVHVTYALPSDAPTRYPAIGTAIATDAAAIDSWWRREDPSRTVRYDLFAFPGCASRLGSLDIGFVRLPRSGAEYMGDNGADALLGDLDSLGRLTSQKHLVYYDGPAPFDNSVCGTAFVPRSATTQGGLSGVAFVWLKSFCGGDVGASALNAAVAVHELIHGLGALQAGRGPNECEPAGSGHVCDSPNDVLYPEATSQTRLGTQILDVGRNDYYGHSGPAFDVQDSAWLSHLPTQRLSIGLQGTGASRGTVRMTSPTTFECAQACNLQLDNGLVVTLVARPTAGARFGGWRGACSGTDACVVTLDAARSVIATFGAPTFRLTVGVGGKGRVSSSPSGLACPARCSASFRASSNVRLRATASPGFVFVRWSGSCKGTSRCVVRLDGNRSVQAVFRKRP